MSTRRRFLGLAAAAGAMLSVGGFQAMARSAALAEGAGETGGAKRILILGGTGFLGPAIMDAALARGHHVTLFNRGRTEDVKDMTLPEGVEVIYGNRDPEKTADDWKPEEERDPASPKGLEGLKGKKWDAVIDTSGYYPRIVKASAELLAPNVEQYIFISSVSVYATNDAPGADETAPVGTIPDPTVETMGAQFENYGPLKALCEQAAEAAMPGRVANVRPGLIVGPNDPTDRWTYWPVRVARGGEVLAPGTPEDRVQIIDVRDLAEWLVHLAETNTTGVFNATGPQGGMPMGEMLEACKRGTGSDAAFTWVPAAFLAEHRVSPWQDMPAWVPPEGDSAGFGSRDVSRAIAAGLKFRPVEETARDTAAWWPRELRRRFENTARLRAEAEAAGKPAPPLGDPAKPRAGLEPEREKAVLEAWRAEQGG